MNKNQKIDLDEAIEMFKLAKKNRKDELSNRLKALDTEEDVEENSYKIYLLRDELKLYEDV